MFHKITSNFDRKYLNSIEMYQISINEITLINVSDSNAFFKWTTKTVMYVEYLFRYKLIIF